MWRILRTLLALVALGGLTAGCSGSQDTDLTITGTINGEEIGEAGRTNPVKIDPELPVRVDVTVSNPTGTDSEVCLLYTSPSPRDQRGSRMPSSA